MAAVPPTILILCLLTPLVPFAAADAPEEATFVVGFHELPEQARAGEVHGERAARVDEALRFAVVHARDARGFEERAAHDPNIRYVQREVYATVEAVPNDPYYAQQFGWARTNAPVAWDVTSGSAAVRVGVVDTGAERTHADFGGSMLPGYDFMYNDADPNDDCGHGTGVAGVIGARSGNALGVAGAAQVSLMPLKALGMNPDGKCYGPFSAVASSIRYAADNGARVISMSLGCIGCYDQATNDAIEYAWARGVVLVASAGNNGPCTNCVSWPAAQPRVIATACTDSANAQCYFSSTGPEVDIAAPGKSIYTTYRNNAYGLMSGTSLSAPHVSGALALAFSANPSLTNTAAVSLLQQTAKDLGAAGVDQTFGAGLLDIGAFVTAAAGGSAPPPPPPPPPANTAPTASFVATPSGSSVNVDASASTDAEGAIASFQWTWGDGLGFGSGDCPTASHAYGAPGTYTITLTVTDAAGATASTTRTVTIAPPPNVAPTASFTTSVSDLTASADSSGSSDSDGTIASRAWSWGDGATSSGVQSSHTYASAGTYTVTLTVTDNAGASSSTTRSVTVTAPAPAPAPVTPTSHVGDIGGTSGRAGKYDRLTWSVLALDQSGATLAGASVRVTLTEPSGATRTLTATTSSSGIATFKVDAPKVAGKTYTLCVGDIVLAGVAYDASANVVSCRSLVTI